MARKRKFHRITHHYGYYEEYMQKGDRKYCKAIYVICRTDDGGTYREFNEVYSEKDAINLCHNYEREVG